MRYREEHAGTSALTALLLIYTVVVVIPHRLEDRFIPAMIIVPQVRFRRSTTALLLSRQSLSQCMKAIRSYQPILESRNSGGASVSNGV